MIAFVSFGSVLGVGGLLFVALVAGYAFRGKIGKEVKTVGASVKTDATKVASKV